MPPKTKNRSRIHRSTAQEPKPKEVALELCLGNNKKCMFCDHKEISDLLYGQLYLLNDIVVHYFCILLSSRSVQNGADDNGIWGFLTKDIKDELTRGSKETCTYCKKTGATIFCCGKKCKKIFHLPCGLRNGSLHQFFGKFKSFCQQHRIIQTVDLKNLESSTSIQCAICTDDVIPKPLLTNIWAPCCKNNGWFHRNCIQELALSAGYFFKCPLCSDNTIFKERMLTLGIYIPLRDASWETTPNAYSELLERPSRCSAPKCLCSFSLKRDYHQESGPWEIILCSICGSDGTHRSCSSLEHDQPWCCSSCHYITGPSERPKRRRLEITSTTTSATTVTPTIKQNSYQSTRSHGNRIIGSPKPKNNKTVKINGPSTSSKKEFIVQNNPILISSSDDEDVQGCPLGNHTKMSKRRLEIRNTIITSTSTSSEHSTSSPREQITHGDVVIISSDDEEKEECESNAQPSGSIDTTTEFPMPVIINCISLNDPNHVGHSRQNLSRFNLSESSEFDIIDLTHYD